MGYTRKKNVYNNAFDKIEVHNPYDICERDCCCLSIRRFTVKMCHRINP